MWLNKEEILVYKNKDNFIYFTAIEIYSNIYNDTKIKGLPNILDQGSLNINFSKYALNLTIFLTNENDQIKSLVLGKYKDVCVDLTKIYRVSDHIIHKSTWYPINTEDIKSLHLCLKNNLVIDSSRLSFKQYYDLINQENIKSLIDNCVDFDSIKRSKKNEKKIPLPNFFVKDLYNYQEKGLNWLSLRVEEGLGCILADEMGLGKTPQIIALLSVLEINSAKPALIVVPSSLLEKWRREIEKFTPNNYKLLVYSGKYRLPDKNIFNNKDIILTSYDIVIRDFALLEKISWEIIIADEAHAIKNPEARRTFHIKRFQRKVAIAVTGTPFENSLDDIWCLFDFVFPQYLGSIRNFRDRFNNNLESAEELEPSIRPLILRRKLNDPEVELNLPEIIYDNIILEMDDESADIYETIRSIIKVENNNVLEAIIRLRQFCSHPKLIEDLNIDERIIKLKSEKYNLLFEKIEEIFSIGKKILIFSSFVKILKMIYNDVRENFEAYSDFIDGSVKIEERQHIIDNFEKHNGPGLLALNPHVAGTGLDITSANYVFLYTPEWKHSTEEQALKRVHRPGQKQKVTVYKFVYKDTVEQIMLERVERKKNMSETLLLDISPEIRLQDQEDENKLLHISPKKYKN